MSSSRWRIVGRIATLRTETLLATVNPDHPAAGLRIENLCGSALTRSALFGVQIEPAAPAGEEPSALPPTDFFVRGNDFVATYSETAERPFRAQIYWRFVEGEPSGADRSGSCHRAAPIAAVELIVSVQTNLLDSAAALTVCSTFGPIDAWQLLDAADDSLASDRAASRNISRGATVASESHASDSPGCCLIRPTGSEFSYIEMVHPADFRQTTFEWTTDSAPVARLAHRLFPERLEKGVILRSRIRGVFVPRSSDTDLAHSEYRRFAASEPPLTA